MDVLLGLVEQSKFFKSFDDLLACDESIKSVKLLDRAERLRCRIATLKVEIGIEYKLTLGGQDAYRWVSIHCAMLVTLPNLKIIEVMRRRNFDRACALFGV